MVKISIEDILFWIFIAIAIGTALWLLHGSPPESSAIITIAITFAGSELLLWRKLFEIDKKTTLGFMKIKHTVEKNNIFINSRFDKIEDKFNNIESKLNTIIRKKLKGGNI